MSEKKEESLIDFPCDFIIKVIGNTHDHFINNVIEIIQVKDKTFTNTKIETNYSKDDKYTSLTCTVYVTNKEDLDHIYSSLSTHPDTKFVL
jgi:putative lipoic acid-binding regulatory protein